MKIVRIQSYSGPHFTAFGLKTERYFVLADQNNFEYEHFLRSELHPFLFSFVLKKASELYSEPCQSYKMEFYTKIDNDLRPLTIFVKTSFLDVWIDFEYASE